MLIFEDDELSQKTLYRIFQFTLADRTAARYLFNFVSQLTKVN